LPNGRGRTEPVNAERFWDDLWLEVICLSNSEIAGSPRNIFRYSPRIRTWGVELWMDLSDASCSIQSNFKYPSFVLGVSPIRLSGAGLRETSQTDS